MLIDKQLVRRLTGRSRKKNCLCHKKRKCQVAPQWPLAGIMQRPSRYSTQISGIWTVSVRPCMFVTLNYHNCAHSLCVEILAQGMCSVTLPFKQYRSFIVAKLSYTHPVLRRLHKRVRQTTSRQFSELASAAATVNPTFLNSKSSAQLQGSWPEAVRPCRTVRFSPSAVRTLSRHLQLPHICTKCDLDITTDRYTPTRSGRLMYSIVDRSCTQTSGPSRIRTPIAILRCRHQNITP